MNLEVKTVCKSNNLIESLGISESRSEELQRALMHAAVDHKGADELASEVSKICNHPNELFFVGVVIGHKYVRAEGNSPDALQELFDKFRKK